LSKDFLLTFDAKQQMNSKPNLAPKSRQLAIKLPAIKHIADLSTINNNYNIKAFLTKKKTRD
tara:strand:+ start:3063 stop:3248 length:186 start_codon:yes stop_codon:yes gene_type:complete